MTVRNVLPEGLMTTRADAEPKQPRGSKLDAKKRSEYDAAVADAAEWDVSRWASWTVTGRVLPERCNVNLTPVMSHGVGSGGRFRLRLEVAQSHVVALCVTERDDLTVFEIADVVRSALAFPVDYIAFQNRGAYEIVLDVCINNRSGEVRTIPIFEPTFDVADAGLCFNPSAENSSILMPTAVAVPLATALHDLTAADRYPRRTFEYCRMAVEVVRSRFDPHNVRGHAERQREGEIVMCAALRVTRKSLQLLDAVAARSRHGALVVSINWEMRKRALELGWEIVARFVRHLEDASNKTLEAA
jgi:hypothetical protein